MNAAETNTGQGKRTIRVEMYSPSWTEEFNREARTLRGVFEYVLLEIHHIGSTAVPGLAAKPVIDILIEVGDLGQVDSLIPAMEALGYEAWGEYGIPQRRFFPKGGNQRSHHVHVFPAGHPEVLRHLRFRDYLRTFPQVAEEYASLKQKLAERHPYDIDGYCEGKDAFISELDRRAEAWADGRNNEVERGIEDV